jgi:hypothetical protein
MYTSISYDPRRKVVGEPSWGQTLDDFYRIHNLDEKRRKYLEDLKWTVNNLSTGGPLNNLLNAMQHSGNVSYPLLKDVGFMLHRSNLLVFDK